jgi:hypothetical protein
VTSAPRASAPRSATPRTGFAGRHRLARWSARLGACGLAAVAAGAGCGAASGNADTDVDAGATFIAFASDFATFRTWPSQSVDNPVAAGSTHVAGPRTVFINQPPPADATSFPVGTMIVKVTAVDGQIFARAKRGGRYNLAGAVDWEWFELEEGSNGVSIKWHGVGPPAGERYGGDPTSGCNPCHATARANDDVLSPWLQLPGVPAAGVPTPDAAAPVTDGANEETPTHG